MLAPFPAFGGKRTIAPLVWERFGAVKQYIEPFCFSAAVLLAAPRKASLEVIGDANGFVANFWRAVRYQPEAVAHAADYPVSHIDLGARHRWLMEQRERLGAELQDANWPGDAKAAGWWLWGQCAWIGGGWCDWESDRTLGDQIPRVGDAGCGVQAPTSEAGDSGLWTSGGRSALVRLRELADRLDRVRVIHGDWSRTLNVHYGTDDNGVCAVFLDPPYRGFEGVYGAELELDKVTAWARDHADLRVALCGHVGDYELPGWDVVRWVRKSNTMGSTKTKDKEAIWFSPACLPGEAKSEPQGRLFGGEK